MEIHIAGDCDKQCSAIVSAAEQNAFSFDWFDPSAWGSRAVPVGSGGRGACWFIDSSEKHWFLRKNRRGGVLGRFIKRTYIFTGFASTRAFREFRLTHELYSAGLAVPEPIAACVRRVNGLFYQCAIILKKIENAKPLDSFRRVTDSRIWFDAGQCIRSFHDYGVCHADLNCKNIMVADRIYLIDFDRGYRDTGDHRSASWKRQNLRRLKRSVDKCAADTSEHVLNRLWRHLRQGYEQGNSGS